MGKGGKIALAGLVAIVLVAMVVAITVGISERCDENEIKKSKKAVEALCSSTDYKDTCHRSLANAKATDPKLLIKEAFIYTIDNIGGVIKNSKIIEEASEDKPTKEALGICEKVLENAVDDLKRSFDNVGQVHKGEMGDIVEDLKVRLSAVGTYQETCIDAFENTTGETGEKMKELLKSAKELASNGLAMVSQVSSILSQLELRPSTVGHDKAKSSSRRLFSFNDDPIDYEEATITEMNKANNKRRFFSLMDDNIVSLERRYMYSTGENAEPAATASINAVVAQDGSGQFTTITEAINTVPEGNVMTFVIYVKAGVYKERVNIPRYKNKIVLIGEGPLTTRITGSLNFADGIKTYETATVAVNSDDFVAKDIAFENSAGSEKHQAVALRVSGDRAVFHNVHIDGYQDSLYAHTYRQYYRDCTISGTIDFVFGDALALFQNCKFLVRKPMEDQACMVTAQGRLDPRSTGAFIIQNGTISADPEFLAAKPAVMAYLGRPWKNLSRTVILQSQIDGFIAPEGWAPWKGNFALDTLYYAEYMNRGLGSGLEKRVGWKGIQKFDQQKADTWMGGQVFKDEVWIKNSGAPYVETWMKV